MISVTLPVPALYVSHLSPPLQSPSTAACHHRTSLTAHSRTVPPLSRFKHRWEKSFMLTWCSGMKAFCILSLFLIYLLIIVIVVVVVIIMSWAPLPPWPGVLPVCVRLQADGPLRGHLPGVYRVLDSSPSPCMPAPSSVQQGRCVLMCSVCVCSFITFPLSYFSFTLFFSFSSLS